MSSYNIYPSLLDAYDYMRCADGYEEQAERERALISQINREPREVSIPASRGTALNRVVDLFSGYDAPEPEQLRGMQTLTEEADGMSFSFSTNLVLDLASRVRGSICQLYTEATIKVGPDTVRLYGYPDYVRYTEVIDLKSTSNYTPAKFASHWQHYVYPYCLREQGYIAMFEGFRYLVAELYEVKGEVPYYDGKIYEEVYAPKMSEIERRLQAGLANFIGWLEFRRDRITDKKIFNQHIITE